MILNLDDLRLVGFWAADCAERALPLFEAKAPTDTRPREAIAGIRVFARGEKRTAKLRVLAMGAHAAAREVGDPAAKAAARAAGMAAAVAYTHPLPTLDQAKHLLGPAVYAALARELASHDDPKTGDDEIRWAINHSSTSVREIIRRWPARESVCSRLNTLYYMLDSELREPGRKRH